MCPRLISLLLLQISLSSCVTVNLHDSSITSKTKIDLPALLVKCRINDIAVVSAPSVSKNNARYYLNKPNGEVIKLDISDFRSDKLRFNATVNDIIITNDPMKRRKYKIINMNHSKTTDTQNDVFGNIGNQMDDTEFMMGPFTEEDHGNWVLSVYYTDSNEDIIELFQVISVEIVENVPAQPTFSRLSKGSDFKLRFAYPIKYLETCELRPPKSTSDRFYCRDRQRFDSCGYIVPNVTQFDEGLWKIIGVGKIVYEAKVYLKVKNKNI